MHAGRLAESPLGSDMGDSRASVLSLLAALRLSKANAEALLKMLYHGKPKEREPIMETITEPKVQRLFCITRKPEDETGEEE